MLIGSVTYILNYLWIRSPRLSMRCKADLAHVTSIDGRKYIYVSCQANIDNFSKYEAYDFNVKSIEADSPIMTVDIRSIKFNNKPITDINPSIISFVIHKESIDPSSSNQGVAGEDRNLDSQIKLRCTYQNQLGNRYEKTLTGSITGNASPLTF